MGANWSWKDVFRPGCLLALLGATILLVCIVKYAWTNHGVDLIENPELANSGAGSIKTMVWMVIGVGMTLFGALLSYVDFTRR